MQPHLSTCDRDGAGRESKADKLLRFKGAVQAGCMPSGSRSPARMWPSSIRRPHFGKQCLKERGIVSSFWQLKVTCRPHVQFFEGVVLRTTQAHRQKCRRLQVWDVTSTGEGLTLLRQTKLKEKDLKDSSPVSRNDSGDTDSSEISR